MSNPNANGGSLADDDTSATSEGTGVMSKSISLSGIMGKMLSSRKKRQSRHEMEISGWTANRQKVHAAITSNAFDLFIGFAIAFNLVILLVEINQRAGCYPDECQAASITSMNRILLGVYTVEAMLRMYVQRDKYHKDGWNILDLSLVVSGYFDEVMSALGDGGGALAILPILRIFRVARFLRGIRLLRFFPELYVMIRGFFFAMKAMAWGLLLIVFLLTIWSALFLEVLNPLNKEMINAVRSQGEDYNGFCEEVFGSLFECALFMFQTLVAGDSWGACAMPIIREHKWTFGIFAMALMSISLGLMNLILAIIVDNANAARESDKEGQLKEKKRQKSEAIEKWKSVMQIFDDDQDGQISYKEMMNGFQAREVHEVLEVMGIEEDDLQHMFKLMDNSGYLEYDEFISSFLKAQSQDPPIYMMMMKLEVAKTLKVVQNLAERLEPAKAQGRGLPVRTQTCEGRPDVEAPAGRDQAFRDLSIVSATPFVDDFRKLSVCLQAQFEALAERLELNVVTQCSQAIALHFAEEGQPGSPKRAQMGSPPLEYSNGHQRACETAAAARRQRDRDPDSSEGLGLGFRI